jgi:prepilin-type N-terminal cleavage/methylation domain-containing protein
MRKDQKGFTLVELLIAVAILSVVTATVAGFIVVGSKTYASANNDITIQQEAQLALNQMSDVMIDTTRSINYAGHRTGSAESQQVLKDSEFTFEPDAKSLTMYNGEAVAVASAGGSGSTDTEIQEGNGNQNYQFYWVKDDETLYYHEIDVKETFPDIDLSDSSAGWEVLAEHVTDFSVDLTQVEEKRVVALELTFEMGNKEYTTSNNVTVRNRILTNDVEIAALDKTVTLTVIPKKSSVILEPGETYHFSTPKVTGKNILDKSVTWTVEGGATAAGSDFTDAKNGIIQIAATESVTSFNVIITTNAKDSDGNPATATVLVYVKRSHDVSMRKSDDSDSDNEAKQVSPNCEFTISAEATGVKLGVSCDGCGDDVSKDKTVVDSASDNGWKILAGADLVTLVSCDDGSATFKVSGSAAEGDVIKIRATSWLSVQKGYGNEGSDNGFVTGVIELKVAHRDSAEGLGSLLKYGEETLVKNLGVGMTTDHPRLVECIRVVDNSGKQADRVLVHYTIGGGYDLRIAPDLFDLDLNGSYTFYIQILDPVNNENRKLYNENKTDGKVIEDDADTIWEEYKSHLSSSSPYGYIGTKYTVTKVYTQILEKPKVTFEYNGVQYRAKELTMDTVNILNVGNGSSIVSEIKPIAYENVEGNTGMNGMRYSVYVGEGNDPSGWTPLYVFNGSTMEYEGTKTVADGAMEINPGGNPFFKTNNVNMQICGTYHIVPGMIYQNLDSGNYEIIGYSGFDYYNLAREKRYYELTESTIHITIDKILTMDINTYQYKGGIAFPLPSELKNNWQFPNSNSTEWQETSSSVGVKYIADGSENAEWITINKVRYRYIAKDNAYEVEPIFVVNGDVFTAEYSCGIYKCAYGDSKWTQISKASPKITSKANVTELVIDDVEYVAKIDTPDESNFVKEVSQSYEHKRDNYWLKCYAASDITGSTYIEKTFGRISCIYDESTETYTIELIDWLSYSNGANHWRSFGTYTWKTGDTKWTKLKGEYYYDT